MSGKGNQDAFEKYQHQLTSSIRKMSSDGRIKVLRVGSNSMRMIQNNHTRPPREPLRDRTNLGSVKGLSTSQNPLSKDNERATTSGVSKASALASRSSYSKRYRRVLNIKSRPNISQSEHNQDVAKKEANHISIFDISSIIKSNNFSSNVSLAERQAHSLREEFNTFHMSPIYITTLTKSLAFEYLSYLIWWFGLSKMEYVRYVNAYDRLASSVDKQIAFPNSSTKPRIETSLSKLVQVSKERKHNSKKISKYLLDQSHATLNPSKLEQPTHVVSKRMTIGLFIESVSLLHIEKQEVETVFLAKPKRDLMIKERDLINIIPGSCVYQIINSKPVPVCFKWNLVRGNDAS